MAIDIPTLTQDDVADFGAFMGEIVEVFAENANDFLDNLDEDRDIDFNELVGLPDQLNYLQWDYDVELGRLLDLRPAFAEYGSGELAAGIDAIRDEDVPAAPTLLSPTSVFPAALFERPQVDLPNLPGTDVGSEPEDAPAITEFATPDSPTFVLPSVPTFEELQLPQPPAFSMPSFTAAAPVSNLSAPTSEFAFVDQAYASDLLDPLVAKLLSDLENGGYGIDTEDEDALWFRARDRAAQAARTTVDAALRQAANLSHPLPQGAMFAAMEQARAAALAALQEANRDIALKRADMYVENRKFTIQEVRQLEAILMNLHNAARERALNAAKAQVELAVAVYDASVRNFQANLEAYKTSANVFETLVRAELSKAEVFKAQIQAEMLRGEFNEQRVKLYNAQLTGLQLVADLYKARTQAVLTQAQIQAQKVDIYRTKVQAYAMRVQAKAAEYDMYKSAVNGELAKLEIYKADISAFETATRAEEARIRTIAAVNEQRVAQYRVDVDAYKAALDRSMKAVDALVERDKISIAALNANVGSFKALADSIIAGVNVRKDAQRMNNDWNIAAVQSRVEIVRQRMEQLRLTMGNRIEIDKLGTTLFMNAMTAALTTLQGMTVKTTAA